MVRVALYSCNFGNYRDEFKLYYNITLDKNIDYFLFTDKNCTEDEINKLRNWNISNPQILEDDEIMDKFRWTAKHVKFILPERLKNYDIIVWVDNKRIHDVNKLTYGHIMKIIKKYPMCHVFNLKHPYRNTTQEELLETIKLGLENKKYGEYFLRYIRNFISKFKLPDTSVIIRRNNPFINETFEHCFTLMKQYKLKRDQNIYNFAFHLKNVTPILLNNSTLDFST
jgi:hypothetical protein